MRTHALAILLAAAALSVAGCGDKAAPGADGASASATVETDAAAPAADHSAAGHEPAGDSEAASLSPTPDGHTFHMMRGDVVSVVLPESGSGPEWIAGGATPDGIVTPAGQRTDALEDGSSLFVMGFQGAEAGNASVTFQLREGAGAEPVETRTINFMVH